jgi:serine/threonine-protein kinase GIN4
LSGFAPFQVHSELDLFEAILEAKYSFPDPEWTEVTDAAKTFVSRLLVVDPSFRLTAKQALKEEWLSAKSIPEDPKTIMRKQSSMNPVKFKQYISTYRKT